MDKKFFYHIVHDGDYNPDRWINTPEIWGEEMNGTVALGVCGYLVLE